MKEQQILRRCRHCVTTLYAHLVFVTKYRRGVFTPTILEDLRALFDSVCMDFNAELTEFNAEDDRVHLLVHYPPKVALSKLVNSLKGVSSRMIREERLLPFNLHSEAELFGRRAISPLAVEAHLSSSFANISSSSASLPLGVLNLPMNGQVCSTSG